MEARMKEFSGNSNLPNSRSTVKTGLNWLLELVI